MDFDTCHNCGELGHFARSCPALLDAQEASHTRPEWCGQCDRETRLIDGMRHGREVVRRCAACHPLRFTPLKQHIRHGGCRALVYTWDNSPCDKHGPLALL